MKGFAGDMILKKHKKTIVKKKYQVNGDIKIF